MHAISSKHSVVFLTIAMLSIYLYSCKGIKTIDVPAENSLPESYSGVRDSSNAANISWNVFNSDSVLVGLLNTAISNNQDLKIALQRIEMSAADVRFHKGLMRPQVTAGATYQLRKFGFYTMDGAGNSTTDITPGRLVPEHLPDYYVGIQSSWEADIRGKLRNKKKASQARYLASIEGKNYVITNLISEVSSLYIGLQALDQQLQIIDQNIRILEEALQVIMIQKEAGHANELAVKQFQSQVYNAQEDRLETEQLIIESENRLNFLLGRYTQPVVRDSVSFQDSLGLNVPVGIPSDLLKRRPDIRQAEFEITAANADLKAARAAFYPSLMITGNVGFQAFNPSYLIMSPQSVAYSLLGGLMQPIVNRSAIKSDFQAATAIQTEAYYNYQKVVLNSYLEVNTEMIRMKKLDKMYGLKEKEYQSSSQSLELSKELFRTGRANYLEILFAQQNLLTSNLELIDIKRRQRLTAINLYRALGGGWE